MLAWLTLIQLPNTDLNFDVRQHEGITITASGIPIVRGSGFQYYAPGWSKGYYSSRWKVQAIKKIDDNTVQLTFNEDGAFGTVTYRRDGNRVIADYEFNWTKDDSALVELNEGLVWVPPFQNGKVTLDGAGRTLPQLPPIGDLSKRLIGSPAKETIMTGSITNVTLTSSEPASTFDGRKYDQEWAVAAPVYWQGVTALPVRKGAPTKVHVEYAITVQGQIRSEPKKLIINPFPVKDGVMPDESIPELIPSPKMSFLDWNKPLTISNLWKFPAGRPKFFDLLRAEIEKRFEFPEVGTLENRVSFDGGMSDFKQREGTYHLKITNDSISVYGQEAAGLRNAMYRLAHMVFVRNGKLCLPTGVIEDEPRSDFRGAHLFVGPQALEFHQKLWTNVLRPLGFNKVVLECERTNWNALPTKNPSFMKQADLVKLFNWYRSQEVEPIPLIQSLGHMGWLFDSGVSKDLAFNSQTPYTLDPRRPGAKEIMGSIWSEAIQTLKPRTMHVGLDEIDMLGFPSKNADLTTDLWKEMVPYLGSIAKQNNLNLMLWGDEGLAPAEAIDATNGDDLLNAAQRRKAIPKGSFVADWHYKAEQKHLPYLKSLQKWKLEGLQPIASTWYRPENIRGFDIAADVEGTGTLQTTWAGYESNESSMLKNLNQFSAFVLAGDYGWSGRLERVEEMPYDPVKVFAKMYNPKQSSLAPSTALLIGRGEIFDCGGIKFSQLEGSSLIGISPANVSSPDSLEVALAGMAKEIAIALTCDISAPMADIIGEVTITYKDGTQEKSPVQYGLHVRSSDDSAATFFGDRKNDRTCLRFNTKPKELKSITFQAKNRFSGLRIDGVTVLPIKGKRTPSS